MVGVEIVAVWHVSLPIHVATPIEEAGARVVAAFLYTEVAEDTAVAVEAAEGGIVADKVEMAVTSPARTVGQGLPVGVYLALSPHRTRTSSTQTRA